MSTLCHSLSALTTHRLLSYGLARTKGGGLLASDAYSCMPEVVEWNGNACSVRAAAGGRWMRKEGVLGQLQCLSFASASQISPPYLL